MFGFQFLKKRKEEKRKLIEAAELGHQVHLGLRELNRRARAVDIALYNRYFLNREGRDESVVLGSEQQKQLQ